KDCTIKVMFKKMFFKYLFLLVLDFLVIHQCNVAANGQQKKIVCYHGSWSAERKNLEKFSLETDVDPSLCTHLMYAFCGVQQTGELTVTN
ncbi:hypothetical protein DOY81_011584, partial [Sarcophaga bullata]